MNDRQDIATRTAVAPIHEDLVKEMAMDIGREIAAYIERMYPKAVKATSQSMLLSVRNSVYNEIMAALAVTDADDIRNRLAQRKSDRRKLKAMYKHIREADWEKMRAAVDVVP